MRLICSVLYLFTTVESAKILAIMTLASKSHHVWNSALTYELARRGHEITYFSPDIDENPPPGIRQILAEGVYSDILMDVDIESWVEKQSPFELIANIDTYIILNCKALLKTKGLDQLIETVKKESFDLILFDVTTSECLLPIADLIPGAPFVGVTPYGGSNLANYLTGNPETLAVKADTLLQISNDMSLYERTLNVLLHWYVKYDRFYNVLPQINEMAQTKFPGVKDVHSVLDRLSLLLINTHFSFDITTPTVPMLVEVGGLQVKPAKPLPKDIQKFLDESTNGTIFFSLGTNVQSSKLRKEKLQILLDAFKELAPVRILWKFETDALKGKPSNVMTSKWLPQNDILAHPNVKLFFTHSGLLSLHEAMYHGKPIVGMPFLADQHLNIKRSVRDGLGEKVDFLTLNKESLLDTIRTVLENPKYREKAQRLSKIFNDQPETPLERATFWIEYVIRHKGAPHLRSASLKLKWYQNELLDVMAVIATLVIFILSVCIWVICFIFKFAVGNNKKIKRSYTVPFLVEETFLVRH